MPRKLAKDSLQREREPNANVARTPTFSFKQVCLYITIQELLSTAIYTHLSTIRGRSTLSHTKLWPGYMGEVHFQQGHCTMRIKRKISHEKNLFPHVHP